MAGLVKPKNYDWKDSNLALFGTAVERGVKKDSATHEEAWKGCGQAVGLKIWRIVNFKVTHWPTEDYGKFFGGDSYIILNTYKPTPTSNELAYDLHFWIGSESTQDEYGTAAYKTVELDTYLDDKPIQHREVQGHESKLFKSYFPRGITIMTGGAESGFRHVEPTKYKPRLFHVRGERHNIVVTQIPLCRSRVLSEDVFILDLGLQFYLWIGTTSNQFEKFQGMQYLVDLKSTRGKATSETLEEDTTPQNHEFYKALTEEDDTVDTMDNSTETKTKQLFRVSDSTGELLFTQCQPKSGHGVSKADFMSDDVFILDTTEHCFVWIGKGANECERKNGFTYAHNHLMKTSHPLAPIIVLKEGQESTDFKTALAA